MATGEADVERAHKGFFFETLARAGRHSRVEIPDIPASGDGHVACVSLAIDENNSALAKQAVVAGIVDKLRNEEILLVSFDEITRHRGTVIDLRKPRPRMRSARPDDHGKGKIGCDVAERCGRLQQIG